ncbi:MAG: hypothetical protein LLG08_05590, partial [Actinomycetia bacterium]|nr:hypothetical protein [Actinomycetes bacterium]
MTRVDVGILCAVLLVSVVGCKQAGSVSSENSTDTAVQATESEDWRYRALLAGAALQDTLLLAPLESEEASAECVAGPQSGFQVLVLGV